MNELKNMTDYQLAQRILDYRNRLHKLMSIISDFLKDHTGNAKEMLEEYKCLKDAVKTDAHYVGLIINRNSKAKHYSDISRALREAAACGFKAPTNSQINQKLQHSIEEAHYRLGKCCPEIILENALQE